MEDRLAAIEKRINEMPDFSREDAVTVHNMIKAYRGIMGFGRAAKFIIFVLATIAAGVAAYDTIIAKLREIL